MALYRKKALVKDPITFEEFELLMKEQEELVLKGQTYLQYKGLHINKIEDSTYLIPTTEGHRNFTKKDMLITDENGNIYLCNKETFANTYELIDDEEETPSKKFIVKFEFTEDTEEDFTLNVKDSFDILGNPSDEAMRFVKTIFDMARTALRQISDAYPSEVDSYGGRLGFGAALSALKNGKCVTRKSWNDNTFLYLRNISDFNDAKTKNVHHFIASIESLPDTIKERLLSDDHTILYHNDILHVSSQRVLVWGARPTDLLAEDWIIFN